MAKTDPAALGFDAKRLTRIDDHLKKYVDDGRLPGWQIQVARGGEVAHFSSYGQRDVEAGTAIEDTDAFGLDAALPAVLLALVLPALRDRDLRRPALLGAAIALVVTPFVPAGMAVLCALGGLVLARPGHREPDHPEPGLPEPGQPEADA